MKPNYEALYFLIVIFLSYVLNDILTSILSLHEAVILDFTKETIEFLMISSAFNILADIACELILIGIKIARVKTIASEMSWR